ncbi:hypothetical protein SELMODRAFT_411830 [Selaginella moellendorffii]|uniref:Uncharacterized protein n=1 Tax=Selaginella moellendorffii TaxID=88036 RepID=D8RJ61_SELML|nr:hypothetical protein SELMODRAFT_411830 [Selaginella moellendorffii]
MADSLGVELRGLKAYDVPVMITEKLEPLPSSILSDQWWEGERTCRLYLGSSEGSWAPEPAVGYTEAEAMGLDLYAVAADLGRFTAHLHRGLGLDGDDIEIQLAWDPVKRAPKLENYRDLWLLYQILASLGFVGGVFAGADMGIGDAPSDLFAKLAAAGGATRSSSIGARGKRKSDCCAPLECPLSMKHARAADGSKIPSAAPTPAAGIATASAASPPPNLLHHHHSHSAAAAAAEEEESDLALASGAAAVGAIDDSYPYACEGEDGSGSKRRILPLWVSTIDGGEHEWEATAPWNVFTKGFFHVRGSDLRAGYWVYYKGHCVARALVWNDEFDEMRYEHQGYSPMMRGLDKGSVSAVSVGLMAILDAIAWSRSLLPFAQWHIYVDNVDALKLVDMYQRNLQFMKFHPERPLLDLIVDAAQSGRIHLHKK